VLPLRAGLVVIHPATQEVSGVQVTYSINGGSAVKVGYARWSAKGDVDANSLKAQRAALSTAGCSPVLFDADSGGNDARPGWLQLKALVETGRVTEVVTKDASRLGRDMAETTGFLKLCRIKLVAVTFLATPQQNIAAGDPTSVHLKISLGLDEYYREETKRKIRNGIKDAQAAGKHRNRVPYGYQRIDGALSPHPQHWDIAQQLIGLLERNRWSAHAALDQARDLSGRRWTASGLRNWLLSPSLRGGVGIGQTKRGVYEQIHWNRHQRLLSDQQYRDALQSIEANRRVVGRGHKQRLSGLVRCVHCGFACSLQTQKQRWSYARCNELDCQARYKSLKTEVIEVITGQAIVQQVDIWMQQVAVSKLPRAVSPELVKLEAELADLKPLLKTGKALYVQQAAAVQIQIDSLLAMPQDDGRARLQRFIDVWAGDINAGELMGWINDADDRAAGAAGVMGHVFRALVESVEMDGLEKRVVAVKLRQTPILGLLLDATEVPDGDSNPLLHGTVFRRLERALGNG
jgi:DNA invertase Pin-like site-specific DNA recombinase